MAKKALKEVRFATAGDVMHKEVVTIEGKKTVADAIRLMREKKVSSLIVNRRGVEDAFGIVTRKDVVSKIVDPGKDPDQVKVFEIMSKPLVTVSPLRRQLKYCRRLVAGNPRPWYSTARRCRHFEQYRHLQRDRGLELTALGLTDLLVLGPGAAAGMASFSVLYAVALIPAAARAETPS